ncbi:MAG TPA: hypothetical protein VIP11_14140, partial [Gemmatimonadaceae bacterium]
MTRGARLARFAALLLAVPAATAIAQDTTMLEARVDRPTYIAVRAIVDSARSAKLPTKPLMDKAFEGAAKGSDGPKIIVAVHQLSVRMGSAKRTLGPSTTNDEIRAAVSAIEAGISVRDLARLRAASGKRPVTMPLAVLTDLVARQVPIPTATDLVLQLARSGVRDNDLAIFQRNVRADIDRGADPSAAATTRARGL